MAATTATIATPIGWIAGAGAAGAAAVFGLTCLVRGGGEQDERRRRMKEDIKSKVATALEQSSNDNDSDKIKKIADLLHTGYLQKKIPLEDGSLIISKLKTNDITPEYALKIISDMLISK